MNIREANIDDIEALNQIYNEAIEDHCTADTRPQTMLDTRTWLEKHDQENYPVWVCENEREVMGWISFSPYRNGRPAVNGTVEFSYYVGRAFQGMGAGSAMMRFGISKAVSLGFRRALAIILERNTRSVIFTEKHGFSRWGYLPGVADFDGEICGHCYYGLVLQ